jgi:hypothetical protein
MQARVRLYWETSASPDVDKQILTFDLNGGLPTKVELGPTVTEYLVVVPEKADVNVELVANDGYHNSSPATLTFNVGDLLEPLPPTGLGWEIVELIEE